MLLTLPNKASVHIIQLRWLEPIYMQDSYVFYRVFQQERLNRFVRLLVSLMKNGGTLRKCHLFSCKCKKKCEILAYILNRVFTKKLK